VPVDLSKFELVLVLKILASAKEQEEVASGPDVVLNVTVKICTKRRRDFMTYLRGRHDGGRVR
jgi:hypothetical protein